MDAHQGATAEPVEIEVRPLTPDRWDDLVELFGARGASGGCWCMWWRLPPKEVKANMGEANKQALHDLTGEGKEPGLLAYAGGRAIGWVSVAPREQFLRLKTSATWKPFDRETTEQIWSIVCFFIDRRYRRQGLANRLLGAAVRYAADRGADVVEAYPKEIHADKVDAGSIYFGTADMFRAAGFEEVVRRRPEFPIMQLRIK